MKTTLSTICLLLGLVLPLRTAELVKVSTVSASTVSPIATNVKAINKPWPHEGSDLRPDAKVTWGQLDNGLRYVILPSQQAPTKASLRLYMDVGSLMETEDQRGIAHFLEHMAFNSTKHFPASEKIEYLQRLGMKFGADTNAFTAMDETVYQLELPRANEELLGDGLKLFRDFLDGMVLDAKELEKERAIVLCEILNRNCATDRAANACWNFELPDTVLSRREPLGDVASVRALKLQQFVDFYETWYTPGRAVIVAVGDFDVQTVERLIQDNFKDVRARRSEQENPSFGKVSPSRGLTARLYTDPELASTTVEFCAVAPDSRPADTVAQRRQELVRSLANVMFNLRLQKLAAAENAPFQSAGISSDRVFHLFENNSLLATCQPRQWRNAIGAMEQELRRALKYGFTNAEFAETKKALLASLQNMIDQANDRQPNQLVANIIQSLTNGKVFTNPTDIQPILNEMLANMKREECEQALRSTWDTSDLRIWVQGNLQIPGDAAAQIVEAYHASQQTPVTAPVEQVTGKWAYTNFGPAGTIVARHDQHDLGVVEAVFANNVRVNVKRTSFEKSAVQMIIRFGGGLLEVPADKSGLQLFANQAFIVGGLEAHSFEELAHITADKQVGVSFSVGDDAFVLGGGCASDALETQLQICTAYLTAPGYRPESQMKFRDSLESMYAQLDHTAEGALSNEGFAFIRSDDPRFHLASRDTLAQLKLDDLRNLLTRPLREGYLEATIVGDIDPDQALKLVAKTLGALPPRAAQKPAFAQERQVKFPVAPKTKEIHFASQLPRAMTVVCWPTSRNRDLSIRRQGEVLAQILSDRLRLKIREELGSSYSPSAQQVSSDAFQDFGFILSSLTVEPKQVDKIGRLVAAIGGELASGEISDDEFQRAIQPVLASLDGVVRNNGYWLGTLCDCQEHPETLDDARRLATDYKSITKAKLQTLAKEILPAEKATVISVMPTATSE